MNKPIGLSNSCILEKKKILVVNKDQDVFESLEKYLNVCRLYKALDYNTAFAYLEHRLFDIIIWDTDSIQPGNLTDYLINKHVLTVLFLENRNADGEVSKCIKQGAIPFTKRNNLSKIRYFLEDILCDRKVS